MRDYAEQVKELRDFAKEFDLEDHIETAIMLANAADAIEELLAAVPTLEKLINILSHYFNIGDSYTYELTRVKEAFELGTMGFDDFSEWDEENVSDLAEYIMKSLPEPPKEVQDD